MVNRWELEKHLCWLQEVLSRGGFESSMETLVEKKGSTYENWSLQEVHMHFQMYCFSNILKSSCKKEI